MKRSITINTTGQAHTLEAVFAALLMLTAVVFALQVTAVTPLTSSTSSQQIQNQQAATANGFLQSSVERDIIKEPILMWNTTSRSWQNTDSVGVHPYGPPGTEFGQQLNETFIEWGVAVNVEVGYYTEPDITGDRDKRWEPYVLMGSPSENSVSATHRVLLYDDDVIHDAAGGPTTEELQDTDRFYAPNSSPDTEVYNIMTIRVTVWRI